MYQQGVYNEQSRKKFVKRFIVNPLIGKFTLKYISYLFKDRLISSFKDQSSKKEAIEMLLFHIFIIFISVHYSFLLELFLFWWLPFILVHPIIGWLSELAEHFPFMEMSSDDNSPVFYSRNRYANKIERIFIGMHGDYLHLTHHLYPRVPHYNLKKATEILREDPVFANWDNKWGGIFTSETPEKISLIKYILTEHKFEE